MKVKVYVVDFEIPRRVKTWGLRLGIPAVALSIAAVAFADPLHVWATGDTLNAADLNGNMANLQAQITALQGQVTTLQSQTPAQSAFRATLTNATTVPANTNVTVQFNNVLFDLSNEYNPATGVFTPKTAGKYFVQCVLQWPAIGGNSEWYLSIKNGGTEVVGTDNQVGSVSGAQQASGLVQLAANDSVICTAYQNASGSTSLIDSIANRVTFSAARVF